MNLTNMQKNAMRLLDRSDKDENGFSTISPMLNSTFSRMIPEELIELVPADDGGAKARFTEEGLVVLKWLVTHTQNKKGGAL